MCADSERPSESQRHKPGSGLHAQTLGLPGTAPEKCTAEVMHAVVQQHMDSPAMWAIFPLQVRAYTGLRLIWPARLHRLVCAAACPCSCKHSFRVCSTTAEQGPTVGRGATPEPFSLPCAGLVWAVRQIQHAAGAGGDHK